MVAETRVQAEDAVALIEAQWEELPVVVDMEEALAGRPVIHPDLGDNICFKREFDTVVRHQAEKFLNDMDVVKREEFEAVKEMARIAREENDALKARLEALEGRLNTDPGSA